MARHAQTTQNNKFAKSLQYSKVFYLRLKLDQNFAQNAQNLLINIGWNRFQIMDNIVSYHPVQTKCLENSEILH